MYVLFASIDQPDVLGKRLYTVTKVMRRDAGIVSAAHRVLPN